MYPNRWILSFLEQLIGISPLISAFQLPFTIIGGNSPPIELSYISTMSNSRAI